jgi:hypothetical protein
MIKEIILGLIVLAYIIPFVYIFLAVIGDVAKRITQVFSLRVKPALVLITKSMID